MPQVKLSFNLDISRDSTWLTVTAAQAARNSIAFVQELGDFHCGSLYYTNRENLSSYLIKLCISGEGLLDYDDKTYSIRPGQLFWIDCRKLQHYRTSPKKGDWRVLWVHFSGVSCEAYYNLFSHRMMAVLWWILARMWNSAACWKCSCASTGRAATPCRMMCRLPACSPS